MRVFELSHVFSRGMPHYHALPPFLHMFLNRLGEAVRGDVTVASDMLVASPHTGTHIDALSHVAHHGPEGVADKERADASALPPFLTRGIVLDLRGAGPEIGRAELERAIEAAGVRPARGDVVLVATGWEEVWARPDEYSSREARPPGIDLDAAKLLVELGVAAIGADTPLLESAASALHVHEYLLDEAGVYIIENLALRELLDAGVTAFLFVALPLRIATGTASPLRPIAIADVDGDGDVPPSVSSALLDLARLSTED